MPRLPVAAAGRRPTTPPRAAIRLIRRRGRLAGMRSRMLDVALIVGLVVVAGGIMWTLFNLGTTSRPASTPSPPAATPRPTAASPTPTTPIAPVAPDAPPIGEAPTSPAAAEGPPSGDVAPAPSAPRPVPPGTVALERVGYSYVTGGPGACGVVLEAWTHVAVSRDLLAAYGCGAAVVITLDDAAGDRTEVVGVIGDTMNPSFERTVNVYVGEDEDAFAYGLTTGTFTPR